MLPSRSNTGVSKTRVSGTGPLVGVPKTLVFDTGEYGANGAALPPLVLRCSSGRAAQGRHFNEHAPKAGPIVPKNTPPPQRSDSSPYSPPKEWETR